MSSPSDIQLVSAARQGNARAWEELVRRHYGLVYGVALARLGDIEAAEDAAQEVFLRLFMQLDALRDGNRFAPWAARAARNLAINWKRDRRNRSRLLPMIAPEEANVTDVPDQAPNPRDHAQRQQEQELLRRVLAALPEDDRELVVLHYLEGCSQRELARRLGVNVSTVSRRLEASLKRLRTGIEQSVEKALQPATASRSRAAARAGALAAAWAALPEPVRADLLRSDVYTEGVDAIASAAIETSQIAVPSAIAGAVYTITQGAILMTTKKTVIVTAVAILVCAGAVLVMTQDRKSATPSVTMTEQAPARHATADAGTTGAEPAPASLTPEAPPEEETADMAEILDTEAVALLPSEETPEDDYDGIALVVRGRVLTERNQPVGDAEVRLSQINFRSLTGTGGGGHPIVAEERPVVADYSDSEGRYELRSRQGPPLQLLAAQGGYATHAKAIPMQDPELRPLAPGTWLLEKDIVLKPASILRGQVIDEHDNPVGDVSVNAFMRPLVTPGRTQMSFETTTRSDGYFQFDTFGEGWVRLETRTAEHAPARKRLELPHNDIVTLRLIEGGATVSGIVTDWNGKPVAGASVTLGNAMPANMSNDDPVWFEETSSGSGEFRFTNIPADSYYIAATTEDGRRTLSRENLPYETVNVTAGAHRDGIELRLFEGYTVTGTVRNALTDEPISSAEVTSLAISRDDYKRAFTGSDGKYVLDGVQGIPDGSRIAIYLQVSGEGYEPPPDNLGVGVRNPQITPEPGKREYTVDLELYPTVEWSGRVLYPGGRPAPAATVYTIGGTGNTTTDESGNFTVNVAANRKAQLVALARVEAGSRQGSGHVQISTAPVATASTPGYPPTFTEPFDVTTEPPPPVEIVLDPGATATLIVQDEHGRPVEGAYAGLMIRTFGDRWSSASRHDARNTPDNGRLVFTELPTEGMPIDMTFDRQSIDFHASKAGYGDAEETRGVTFAPGEHKEIVITLPSDHADNFIAGTVTDSRGNPVPNAKITFYNYDTGSSPSSRGDETVTGEDGRFRREQLPNGNYHITAHHAEQGSAATSQIQAGTEDLVIVLGEDRIILTVILVDSQTGDTIPGGRAVWEFTDPPTVGISDIPSAHRFPRFRRDTNHPVIITAPGYKPATELILGIPAHEEEHIHIAEMEPED